MNLELLDPFENDFPEVIEDCLVGESNALCCACNRRGTLLAVGCADGRCIIWDFDTRGIARSLFGHIHPITSVSWSRNGRKLLSSSTDWTVKLWDVLSGAVDITIRFETAVSMAQMHPRDNTRCVVCPISEPAVLVDLTTGEKKPLPMVAADGDGAGKEENRVYYNAVTFNKRGDIIFAGDSKGTITLIESEKLHILQTTHISGKASIKSIQFSKCGKHFVINSTDRIVRSFDVEEVTTCSSSSSSACSSSPSSASTPSAGEMYSGIVVREAREFQDVVNRMQWKKCCFSCDGDYIIGGSAQKAEHNIYIWNRAYGRLVKILEGPKEGIMDLVWHPLRPIIVSCSVSGVVYIWATNYTENWSAFAPDFTELQENEEYQEREDEFDIVEEDEVAVKKKQVEEDEEVDIMTVDRIAAYSSEEEDELWFIPTAPIPDVPRNTIAVLPSHAVVEL